VAPAALEVSMAAAAQAEDERAMLASCGGSGSSAPLRRRPARPQYQLAEPENRLVARQLEADWEAALAETARWKRTTSGSPNSSRPSSPPPSGRRSSPAGDLRESGTPSTTQADRRNCCAS